MFFSLHSMTCSISSLGGDYVRRGFCPTENRRGFCPGGLLSGGLLSGGDFVQGGFCPGLFALCGSLRVSINRHEGRLIRVSIAVRVVVRKCPKTVFIQSQCSVMKYCRAYSQYYCPAFYNYALSAQFRTYELDPFSW